VHIRPFSYFRHNFDQQFSFSIHPFQKQGQTSLCPRGLTGIVIGSYVLSKGKRIIREKRLFSRSLTGEEKLSVIFTGAIIFLSLKNFDFISGFSVANMSAALIILIASRSCGSSVTAAVGICLGLLSGIETDYFLPLMGAFGFCALFTGMVAKRGKLWAIGGLVAANIVVVVYVNGAMRNILNIYEIFKMKVHAIHRKKLKTSNQRIKKPINTA